MPSLDGYSLNQKMDKEFDRVAEEIAVLRFRIETEMQEVKEKFEALVPKKKPKGK